MSDSSRIFSVFSHVLNISRRVNLRHYLRQFLAIALMLSLAFPQTVWADTFSTQNIISVNVLLAQIKAAVNGQDELMDPLERSEPEIKKHKEREEKDVLSAKVAKLKSEIPTKLEMYTRQRMQLSAIPNDNKGQALQGLKTEFSSSNNKVAMVIQGDVLIAGNPGTTTITAKAGTQISTTEVTVVHAPKVKLEKPKIGLMDTGGIRNDKIALNKPNRPTTKFATGLARVTKAATAAFQSGGTPPSSYQTTRIYDTGRPANRTEASSSTPAAATEGTERPGSADFSFGVPLVNLAGRGPGVGLGLYYNSLVWKKNGLDYYFDNMSSLAPGFNLGYGKMSVVDTNYQAYQYGTLSISSMIDGDGTQQPYQLQSIGTFQATDGSFTRFLDNNPQGYHSVSAIGTKVYTDGTRVDYGAGIQTSIEQIYNGLYWRYIDAYPTKITDRNGNYIKINYINGVGPKISSIEDSLGRYVKFYYNAGGELFTITVPGYSNSGELVVARFYYQDLAITAGFQNPGSGTSNPGTKRVLKYVFFPGNWTASKYEYSSYGMIYRIKQYRGFFTADPFSTIEDYVTQEGTVAATTTYNYPLIPSNLTDVPQFTQRNDNWAGNTNGGDVITTFSSNQTTGITTVTDAYGRVTETKKILTGSFTGLVNETCLKNSSGTVLAKTVLEYDPNQPGVNSRVSKSTSSVTVGGGQLQSKITEYTYDSYNNVTLAIEKGYDGIEIRRTETTYETGAGWINRWLIHLPKSIVLKAASSTVASRTDFVYDNADTGVTGNNLLARSSAGCTNVASYDKTYDPYACPEFIGYTNDWSDPDCQDSQCWINGYPCDGWCPTIAEYSYPYNSATAYRGNVTKTKRWAKPAATETASLEANQISYTYDIAGNLITETASCCNLKTYTYIKANEFTYPSQVARGTGGQLTSTATYDFNTGLVREARDENNQLTTYDYDTYSFRPFQVIRPDGGKTVYAFLDLMYAAPDINHMNYYVGVTNYTGTNSSFTTYQFYNGIGQPTRTFGHSNTANTTRSISDVEYDPFGRPNRRNSPYYGVNRATPIGGSWAYSTYDDLNRVTAATAPDGSTTVQMNYDGSTAKGTVQTVTDQALKQRRSITDAIGRLLEVHEPDASGNIGTLAAPTQKTNYEYDVLGNAVKTIQINTAAETQCRYFKYDGLSRLTHERQVEQVAPHVQADPLTNNNNWSKKIVYDLDGKVLDAWDARGTNTHFTYSDPLNRLTGISYSGGSPTVATPSVTYTYDQPLTGYFNQGRLTEAKTAALGSAPETKIQYNYDVMGRVSQHKQIVGSNTYAMAYGYNQAGQLTSETYPSGRVVTANYMAGGGGLTSVADADRTYASAINYTPHGAMSTETLGNGAVQTMAFNDRLQLSQINLVKSGTELQRYDYSYGQYDANNTALDATKNNGQIAKISGFIGGAKQWEQRHTYDSLGRLCVAGEYRGDNNQVSWRTHYGYDRFGNRYQNSTQTQNIGLAYVNVANADVDRTTNRFASGITYDAGGNVTNDNKFKANVSFAYDANDRVVSTNNGAMTAVFNASGQRICATVSGVATTSVYDVNGRLIAEYNGATLIREYIVNVATVEGSIVRYLMSNHLGSNSVVMNDTSGVVARHDYLPFGEEIVVNTGLRTGAQGYGASDPSRTRFAGMERETANGLDHTLFRKAETKSGRWNSPDPYTGSMRVINPQSLNRYQYTLSDPINLVDPLGLYEGCTHGAQAEFVANRSGNISPRVAKQLGDFASELPGGADSFKYSATNPKNIALARFGKGPSANIHFASDEQLFYGKAIFHGLIDRGEDVDIQRAGFIVHSIQDHGPHGGREGLNGGRGHFDPTKPDLGKAVDRVGYDYKAFKNLSDDLLRLFSNDQSKSLSSTDQYLLLLAIFKRCSGQADQPIPLATPGNVGGINPRQLIGTPNISGISTPGPGPWRFPYLPNGWGIPRIILPPS